MAYQKGNQPDVREDESPEKFISHASMQLQGFFGLFEQDPTHPLRYLSESLLGDDKANALCGLQTFYKQAGIYCKSVPGSADELTEIRNIWDRQVGPAVGEASEFLAKQKTIGPSAVKQVNSILEKIPTQPKDQFDRDEIKKRLAEINRQAGPSARHVCIKLEEHFGNKSTLSDGEVECLGYLGGLAKSGAIAKLSREDVSGLLKRMDAIESDSISPEEKLSEVKQAIDKFNARHNLPAITTITTAEAAPSQETTVDQKQDSKNQSPTTEPLAPIQGHRPNDLQNRGGNSANGQAAHGESYHSDMMATFGTFIGTLLHRVVFAPLTLIKSITAGVNAEITEAALKHHEKTAKSWVNEARQKSMEVTLHASELKKDPAFAKLSQKLKAAAQKYQIPDMKTLFELMDNRQSSGELKNLSREVNRTVAESPSLTEKYTKLEAAINNYNTAHRIGAKGVGQLSKKSPEEARQLAEEMTSIFNTTKETLDTIPGRDPGQASRLQKTMEQMNKMIQGIFAKFRNMWSPQARPA